MYDSMTVYLLNAYIFWIHSFTAQLWIGYLGMET